MSGTWCACIMGQGGALTSFGMGVLTRDIRELGISSDVYPYGEWQAIEEALHQHKTAGDKVALVGYSLGDSTATYLGTRDPVDLLIAIFESSLAQNYPIDHSEVKHSALFHGPGFLSDAGLTSKFDEVVEVPNFISIVPVVGGVISHLAGQFSPIVTQGVLQRLAKLKEATP